MSKSWQPVPGYNGMYEVSDTGEVRSFKYGEEIMLKPWQLNNGYLQVALSKNATKKGKCIHRLVAEAFIRNPNNKPEVNHKDGNKTNNHADNLEWATSKENIQHGESLGLMKKARGEDQWKAKLSETDVLDIRNTYRLGCFSQAEIARAYDVTQSLISRIVRNEYWTHI